MLASRRIASMALCAAAALWLAYCFSAQKYYYIFDGQTLIIHRTTTADAQLALVESGVFVREQDYVYWPDDISAGIAEIFIDRADTISIRADGQLLSAVTQEGTVETALQLVGVSLRAQDEVNPPLGSPLENGMLVTVTRVDTRREELFEEIPFETEYTSTKKLLRGQSTVISNGEPGQLVTTFDVTLRDGVEASRSLLYINKKEPVDEIIEMGTQDFIVTPDGTVLRYTRMLEVSATAYTTERQTEKRNALGNIARPGTIAVDPRVIPLRSKVYVQDARGRWHYGIAICEDTGGAVKGNIVDLYFDTWDECVNFGRRKAIVYILE